MAAAVRRRRRNTDAGALCEAEAEHGDGRRRNRGSILTPAEVALVVSLLLLVPVAVLTMAALKPPAIIGTPIGPASYQVEISKLKQTAFLPQTFILSSRDSSTDEFLKGCATRTVAWRLEVLDQVSKLLQLILGWSRTDAMAIAHRTLFAVSRSQLQRLLKSPAASELASAAASSMLDSATR